MGRQRRQWTSEEDSLLRNSVEKVMTPQKALEESRPLLWREIAKDVPGRTNKDCRRRWSNSLNDSISKGRWSQVEDQRLFQGVQKYGTNWVRVAAIVRTRNPDQCATHWGQALNPAIDYSDWSDAEDSKLLDAIQQYGTVWSNIASSYFQNRTPLSLKNRYSALCKRARFLGQSGCIPDNGSSPRDSNEGNSSVFRGSDCTKDHAADERSPEAREPAHSNWKESQFMNNACLSTGPGFSQEELQSPGQSYAQPTTTFGPLETLLSCAPSVPMSPTSASFMHSSSESQSQAGASWNRQDTGMIQNFLKPSSLDFPTSALLEMPNIGFQTATPTDREGSQGSDLTSPLASDQTLQHVSIDIVCCRDQLGHIMGILVGLTTSMTVRLGDRSL